MCLNLRSIPRECIRAVVARYAGIYYRGCAIFAYTILLQSKNAQVVDIQRISQVLFGIWLGYDIVVMFTWKQKDWTSRRSSPVLGRVFYCSLPT